MIKKQLLKFTGFIILIAMFCIAGFGQLSFTASGTQTIDFSTSVSGVNNSPFTGAGFVPGMPGPGQLNSGAFAITGFSDGDLAFGGTQIAGDYARGATTGGVGTGGVYSLTPNVALYIQPGGTDFTPGDITLRIQNNGATNIQQFTVSYDILVLNDQPRANSFNFSYSSDNVAYTPFAAANYTSTETVGIPVIDTINRGPIVISGLTIAPGGFFYLRWTGDDVSGTGGRDEFGLDNISVTAQFQPTAASGNIAGRVLSSRGRGLRFVTVMITGNSLPEPLYATTNMFGRYQFEDLPVGDTYVLQVFSKRYTFDQPSMLINLDDNITDANFIGSSR